jgi:hypothetical protein
LRKRMGGGGGESSSLTDQSKSRRGEWSCSVWGMVEIVSLRVVAGNDRWKNYCHYRKFSSFNFFLLQS